MKISFTGHVAQTREQEITQQELADLFDVMRSEFLDYVKYSNFEKTYSETSTSRFVGNLCRAHEVDFDYSKDRTSFIKAILEQMENPYRETAN